MRLFASARSLLLLARTVSAGSHPYIFSQVERAGVLRQVRQQEEPSETDRR